MFITKIFLSHFLLQLIFTVVWLVSRFLDDVTSSDHVQPGPSSRHPGRDDPERTHRGDEQEPRPRSPHRHRQDGRQLTGPTGSDVTDCSGTGSEAVAASLIDTLLNSCLKRKKKSDLLFYLRIVADFGTLPGSSEVHHVCSFCG